MSTRVRRPPTRLTAAAREAFGLAVIAVALFAVAADPTGDLFVAFAVLGWAGLIAFAWGRFLFVRASAFLADRRAAAAAAFQAARPDRAADPRNRTGPSITIWPDDERNAVVAFVEYPDGRVDDLTIDVGAAASFGAIVELLYRLAAGQVRIVASITAGRTPADDFALGLSIRPRAIPGVPIGFPPESLAARNAAIAERAAAFDAAFRPPSD